MRIVDTFLFSEPFEKTLLLLKLTLETPGVDRWIAIENAFTFRGEYKGTHLRAIIESDAQFAAFKNKIHIITLNSTKPERAGRDAGPQADEERAFTQEIRQREAARDYLLANYDDTDWFVVTDVDESIDFAHPDRSATIHRYLDKSNGKPFNVHKIKYWYDFDNRGYTTQAWIPFQPVGMLRRSPRTIASYRLEPLGTLAPQQPCLAFEYSYCLSPDDMWRKLSTFAHTGYTRDELDVALKCNHWVRRASRGEIRPDLPEHFFEQVVLTEANSPAYVRENLTRLKTHAVDPHYLHNRRSYYGEDWGQPRSLATRYRWALARLKDRCRARGFRKRDFWPWAEK